MTVDDPCADYVRYLEALDRESVDQLDRYVSEDVHFRDPFNDSRGIARMRAILTDMFDSVESPRFEVTDHVCGDTYCYLDWRLSGTLRALPRAGQWSVEGVSRVRFDSSGRVAEHIDFWDAASGLYESLPILGRVLRVIRRRIAAD